MQKESTPHPLHRSTRNYHFQYILEFFKTMLIHNVPSGFKLPSLTIILFFSPLYYSIYSLFPSRSPYATSVQREETKPPRPIPTLQQASGSKLPLYPQKHCKPLWWLYNLQENSNPFPRYSDAILESWKGKPKPLVM
jgi:hypothetical protein